MEWVNVEHYLRNNPACWVAFIAGAALYYLSLLVFRAFPFFRKLSKDDQVEWASRVVSTMHAVVVTYGGLKILASPVYDKFPYTAWSDEGGIYANILLGYLSYDLVLCLAYDNLRTPSAIIHHLLGLFYYTVVCTTHHAQYLAMLWLASELTTPLVNMRWFLMVLKQSHTTFYAANGLLMTFAFLAWRVLYLPANYLYTLYYFSDQVKLTSPIVQPLVPVSMPSITLLNMYWTFLMIRGLVRHLGKKDKHLRQKAA